MGRHKTGGFFSIWGNVRCPCFLSTCQEQDEPCMFACKRRRKPWRFPWWRDAPLSPPIPAPVPLSVTPASLLSASLGRQHVGISGKMHLGCPNIRIRPRLSLMKQGATHLLQGVCAGSVGSALPSLESALLNCRPLLDPQIFVPTAIGRRRCAASCCWIEVYRGDSRRRNASVEACQGKVLAV